MNKTLQFWGGLESETVPMWHKIRIETGSSFKKFPFSLETDANSIQLLSASKLVWQSIFNH